MPRFFAPRVLLVAVLSLLAVACGPKKAVCSNECTTDAATECAGDQVKTCSKGADGCFKLSAAVACPPNETCQGNACACTNSCGGVCCSAGAACIAGACCESACHTDTMCGCEDPLVCAADSSGVKSCLSPCSLTRSCQEGCCLLQADGTGACAMAPAASPAGVCKCHDSLDCAGFPNQPACAPGSKLGVGGPNVCMPADGTQGAGCNISTCNTGFECWQNNSTGNAFCTKSCAGNADCAAGSCCRTEPDASCNVQGASCMAAGGCMACPTTP